MIESIILEGMLFRNPAIFQKTQGTCVLMREKYTIWSPARIRSSGMNSFLLLSSKDAYFTGIFYDRNF